MGSSPENVGAVLSGQADYFLDYTEIARYYLRESQARGIRELYTFPTPDDGVLLVHETEPLLLSMFNKAIADIQQKELPQILDKWYNWGTTQSITVDLTEEERQWLSDHPVVRVATNPHWAPVEYCNEKGKYRGISIDYLTILEGMLGIRFESVPDANWEQLTESDPKRQIDMVSCITETTERKEHLSFTQPFITFPAAIFAREDVPYVRGPGGLKGKRVAVVSGHAVEEWLARDYPEIHVKPVKTTGVALEKLLHCEVYAFVGNLATTGYTLSQMKLTGIKVAGNTPYECQQSMAVRNDWPVLKGILQKGLDAIPPARHDEINSKWFAVKYEYGFDYALLWRVLAGAAVVLGVVLYWNKRLKRAVALRTRELRENDEKLRESEKKFRLLYENAQVGWGFTRISDGSMIQCNRQLAQIFGYETEEQCIAQWVPSERYVDPSFRSALLAELHRSGEIKDFEAQFMRQDGKPIWVRYSSRIHPDNGYIETLALDITEHKQAEEALRDSETRLNAIFDHHYQLTGLLDCQGRLLAANRTALMFAGVDKSEVIGSYFWDTPWWDQSQKPEIRDAVERAAQGEFVRFETANTTNEDELRFIDFSLSPVKDDNGTITYLVPEGRDVTEIRQSQEALKKSEEQYRLLFESANDAIIVHDLVDEVPVPTDVNVKMEELTGYSKAELLDMGIEDWSPGDPDAIRTEIGQKTEKAKSGDPQLFEWDIQTKAGAIVHTEVSLKQALIGGVFRIVGIIRDITERKRAEEELVKSSIYLDTMGDALIVLNLKREVVRLNRAAMELLGYLQEDISELVFEKLFPETEHQKHFAAMRQAAEQETALSFETCVLTKSGRKIPILLTGAYMKDSQGKRSGYVGVCRDITEQKEVENKLRNSREML